MPAYQVNWFTNYGVVKGDFMHPAGPAGATFVDVILQDENVARGYYKFNDQSGSFLREAQP